MIDYIHNRDGRATSTQVSRMDDITEDVFTPEFYFLIKNTNDNEVTVEIRPALIVYSINSRTVIQFHRLFLLHYIIQDSSQDKEP